MDSCLLTASGQTAARTWAKVFRIWNTLTWKTSLLVLRWKSSIIEERSAWKHRNNATIFRFYGFGQLDCERGKLMAFRVSNLKRASQKAFANQWRVIRRFRIKCPALLFLLFLVHSIPEKKPGKLFFVFSYHFLLLCIMLKNDFVRLCSFLYFFCSKKI